MNIAGKIPTFKTKLEQSADMLVELEHHFKGINILCAWDSWFGNNGLYKPTRKHIGSLFDLLSRLRSNTALYSIAPKRKPGQRGRHESMGIV